ncbi:V-type ATP synthase subunit F [Nitrospira sp. Kam-Ns4a]
MARLRVLTDSETALGFRLAGVEVTEVATPAEAGERLLALLRARETGIVIYNEDFVSAVPEPTRTALEESLTPVFFALPVARTAPLGEPREDYLARLLRRAIGYQLKLKR